MTVSLERPVRPLPTWLVSTRHGTRIYTHGAYADWRPFGVQHARQVGSNRTACGIAALDWELFWDLAFPSEASVTCQGCLHVVTGRDRGTSTGLRAS